MSLIVILMNISEVPAAFATIVDSAFNVPRCWRLCWCYGMGGNDLVPPAGSSRTRQVWQAPIAHAVAQTNEPVEQGLVAMLNMIDTLIVCTMTGLVIVLTGVLESGVSRIQPLWPLALLAGGEWS